jgi:O-antigen ligase
MAYISKIELVIFAVFSLITQFSMQSRIGVIGFLIITTVSMLYYVKMKTPYFKAILYVGAILAVMLFFIFTKTGVMKATQDRPREISYAFATSYIHDHFWWGCGTGEQQTALHHQDEIMPEVNLLPGFPPYLYSHNQFLGEMVQFGIVGLIVLSTLLIGLIYYSFKTRNYLLQMLMLLYILFMMIEEPLYAQEGIMRFMVFLTFFIAVGKSEKNRKSFSLNNIFSKTKIQG